MPLIVDKGSVALDGVSLTIAEVGSTWFEIALIPTTLERTTLGRADIGTPLNIEADCVAKMVGRWLEAREPGGRKSNEDELPDAAHTPLV
jgi:riboflavin synthase